MSKTEEKAAQELTEVMEKTMQRLQGRFQAMSDQLNSKNILYRMGSRIYDLEKNVSELMTQAGMDNQAEGRERERERERERGDVDFHFKRQLRLKHNRNQKSRRWWTRTGVSPKTPCTGFLLCEKGDINRRVLVSQHPPWLGLHGYWVNLAVVMAECVRLLQRSGRGQSVEKRTDKMKESDNDSSSMIKRLSAQGGTSIGLGKDRVISTSEVRQQRDETC
ncbi:hypothetical protein WMY93_019795 [Mugilogobius chulae]|uniref:Uncharacterized protein n=1 Tax=Mugilogobius chulae TaxID=88201 RepID=A0AAW0NK03_9GOBI